MSQRASPGAYNYIDGHWVRPKKSSPTFENRNPATGELINVYAESAREDVDRAVQAAKKAFQSWRLVPVAKRGDILLRSMQILIAKKEAFARAMTAEMGKVLSEARGDVQEAIDTALYYAGEGRRFFGETTTSELPEKFAMTVRMPMGVCGLVTPWNFPMAIPSWKIYPALLCGNTVVLKSAELTPDSARHFVEALEEAGVPAGVVNLINGRGPTVGRWLVTHPDVRLVSFTGSSRVGGIVGQSCGKLGKKCSLELGGKNAQIVMEDADLDLALEGALWGAFGTAGQRCTATSRLILHKDIADEFLERFVAAARAIKIGNGLDDGVQMGPIVSRAQLNRVANYVRLGVKKDGARLLTGGRVMKEGDYAKGFFFEPTVFAGRPGMTIAREEIFGPVVIAMTVKNFDEAMAAVNATDYGLSGSLYTQNVGRVMRAVRDMETGITYINAPTIGAEVHLPFGGVKKTGNGHREAGTAVLDVFSERKAVYIDYSGRLQRAQIDTHEEKS